MRPTTAMGTKTKPDRARDGARIGAARITMIGKSAGAEDRTDAEPRCEHC